jgi:hypothetical protein
MRFQVLNVTFNELDQHYSKVLLECISRGVANKDVFRDLKVEIKPQGQPLVNEVKKRGVMFDKGSRI